jgi:hypothetical protein
MAATNLNRTHIQVQEKLVAPAGFEPAISALRGLRPRPLDDGAALVFARDGANPDASKHQLRLSLSPLNAIGNPSSATGEEPLDPERGHT